MLRSFRVLLIAATSCSIFWFSPTLAQPELKGLNAEESALLQMASNGFRLSGKMHPPLDDTELLLEISTGKEQRLHELARLILLRDLALVKKEEAVERFGDELARAQEVVSEGILNSAGRQSVAEFVGDGLDVLGELQDIAGDVGASPAKAYSAMTDQYKVARRGIIIEGLIADSILRLLEPSLRNPIKEEAFRLRPTYTRRSERPFSCFRLTNKLDEVIPWAVVVLRIDCEFSVSQAKQTHTATGQGLGRLLLGDMVPDYSGRLKAREAYGNTDKCAVYFVRDWRANQELQMVSLAADEFYQTAKAVNVQILTAQGSTKMDVDVEKYRKLLKLRFDRPQRQRRR